MKKTITVGTQNIDMTANAATPFFYNQVFGEDFFTQAQTFDDDNGASVDAFSKIGYVMAKQADTGDDFKKMGELTTADYVEWLTGFATMDLVNAIPDIAELYTAQSKTTTQAKK